MEEERVPFCPVCGAPQIRVSMQPAETPELPQEPMPELPQEPMPELPQEPSPDPLVSGPSPVPAARLQWGIFFRLASPLAALAGFLGFLFSPLIVVLILPLCLRKTLNRYRPYHARAVSPSEGSVLGAFMALLSFAAFLIFSLATLSVKREFLQKVFQDQAAQNHDPQSQQFFAWVTSNHGFAIIMVLALFFALCVFLVTGAISGAVMAGRPKDRV
jgi:hypothetical protein